MILGSVGLAGYAYYAKTGKSLMADRYSVNSLLSKVTAPFQAHDHSVMKPVLKTVAKKPATEKTEPTVQFDFYDELPNIQMAVSTTSNIVTAERSVKPDVVAAKLDKIPDAILKPMPVIAKKLVKQQPASIIAQVKKPDLFSANEVSQLLASENDLVTPVNSPAYLVQLGVFETAKAAELLRDAISSVGFDARVVRVQISHRQLYQVQQGPYETKQLALQSQQRLQKRGIVSVILKSAVEIT